MNSLSLHQEHTDIYEKFFSHHELIFSLPLVMTWCGDISGENMMHIQSRIPLRVYTGINATNSGGIRPLEISSYKSAEKKFHTVKISGYMPYIDAICRDLSTQYPEIHGEVSMLAEGNRSMGLGCTPIVLFSIFLTVRILRDPSLREKLYELSKKGAAEYNTNQTLKILIQDFITLVRPYKLSGTVMNVLASFFADAYPFCGFGTGIGIVPSNHDAAMYSFSLRDFLPPDAPMTPYHALDVSIFYTGQPVFSEQLIAGFSSETDWLDQTQKVIRQTLDQYPHNILPYMEPPFLRHGNDFDGQHLAKKYTDMLSLNTLEVFDSMLSIYLHSYDEDFIKSFLQKLNKITWVNYVTRTSAKSVIRIKSKLGYLFKNYISRTGFFTNDTTVMGGCINIASPAENLQKEIEKNLNELREETPESAIIYVSWKDGFENEGFHIDQDVWRSKMSAFSAKNMGILQYVDGKKQIISVQELESMSKSLLIFDTLRQKVLAHRRQFTSKDLPSQQATCDIMKTLILAGGNVDSSSLPRSAYSSNKNDMQGKIFTPLNRVCHTVFGKDFPMKITGSINDFHLSLNTKNMNNIAIFYEITS